MTARSVFVRISDQAAVFPLLGPGTLQDILRRGGSIPDAWLPGRMIMRLSAEEREALRGLRAEHTQDRRL